MIPNQPLKASISARFRASLTGPNAAGSGIVAVGGVISLVSILARSNLGLAVGASGLALGIAHLFFVNTKWGRKPAFSSLEVMEADGAAISVRAPSSAAAVMLLREAFQGRKPLPSPTGQVLGNAASQNALRPYSVQESQEAAVKIQNEIEQFERKIALDALDGRLAHIPVPVTPAQGVAVPKKNESLHPVDQGRIEGNGKVGEEALEPE